jgi:hypothetical protein
MDTLSPPANRAAMNVDGVSPLLAPAAAERGMDHQRSAQRQSHEPHRGGGHHQQRTAEREDVLASSATDRGNPPNQPPEQAPHAWSDEPAARSRVQNGEEDIHQDQRQETETGNLLEYSDSHSTLMS